MLAQYLVRLICFQSIILLDELLHPLLALFVFLVSKSICNTPYDIQFLLDFVLTEMILLDADARRTPPPSPLPRHTCIKKHPLSGIPYQLAILSTTAAFNCMLCPSPIFRGVTCSRYELCQIPNLDTLLSSLKNRFFHVTAPLVLTSHVKCSICVVCSIGFLIFK
jgi:hypothetical protein